MIECIFDPRIDDSVSINLDLQNKFIDIFK